MRWITKNLLRFTESLLFPVEWTFLAVPGGRATVNLDAPSCVSLHLFVGSIGNSIIGCKFQCEVWSTWHSFLVHYDSMICAVEYTRFDNSSTFLVIFYSKYILNYLKQGSWFTYRCGKERMNFLAAFAKRWARCPKRVYRKKERPLISHFVSNPKFLLRVCNKYDTKELNNA